MIMLLNRHATGATTSPYVSLYDSFGRRLKKAITPIASEGLDQVEAIYYLYANEGLIGEYAASGTLKKAYGWIPDSMWGTAPVFMLQNDEHYFYHNDHLGAPDHMTDKSGATVWTDAYETFGATTINLSSTIQNQLRFPGQYYDEETGLLYNLNRYYESRTGRYIQCDPIGLAANDENLYRYAANNTLYWIDPEGLFFLENISRLPPYVIVPVVAVITPLIAPTVPFVVITTIAVGIVVAIPSSTAEEQNGIIILEKGSEVDRADSASNKPPDAKKTKCPPPAKSESKVWQKLKNYRNGTKTNGTGKKKRYFEWDHTHGDIEVYDQKGRHIGSIDANTGLQTKPAVPGRTIDL